MKSARPEELHSAVVPVVTMQLTRARLEELFPVPFVELDPLAAAEPAIGALIRLDSGAVVTVTFGTITGSTEVEFEDATDLAAGFRDLLREVPVTDAELRWIRADALGSARELARV